MSALTVLHSICRAFARLMLAVVLVAFIATCIGFVWYHSSYDGRMMRCQRDVEGYYLTMSSSWSYEQRKQQARKYCAKQLAMRWQHGSQ